MRFFSHAASWGGEATPLSRGVRGYAPPGKFFQLLTVNSAILAYFYLETAISLHYKTLIWHFSTQGHFIYQPKYLTEHNE